MLKPPDSLDLDEVLAGRQAWMFAVMTVLDGQEADAPAALDILRKVAGFS